MELGAIRGGDIHDAVEFRRPANGEYPEDTEYYFKSVADKVIARHKYKRCLAMASSCSDKASADYASSYVSCDEYYYHHAEFWVKWSKRWLELAEKFKEYK